MKFLKEKNKILSKKELYALSKLKNELLKNFPGAELILFGSKARGDFTDFSDLDVLILVDQEVDYELKDKIIEIAYDIELENDIVFGLIIENKKSWRSSRYRVMPLYKNVVKEGAII
ncbi:MAG: nucleotidyltransferase domain-containing protein [Actinobacteria bacterium]|nr:nucleotidyltransferase domain-containing protein [Actinomycetota bacterium]